MRSAGRGTDAAIRSQLKEAPRAKRRELLVGFVRQQAEKTLGISEAIDAARPLREFGLDSLMSVTLVNRLEAALGIKVSTVKLIQGPSVEQLVDDLLPDVTGIDEDAVPHATPRSGGGDVQARRWEAHVTRHQLGQQSAVVVRAGRSGVGRR